MEWDKIVKSIQDVIEQIREEYVIKNIIFRDDVFRILEKYCTVLYYPIQEEKNCGFHIKKIVNNDLEDFVYINTAKPIEEQVFTAAHELGHIWNVASEVWSKVGSKEPLSRKMEEDITNRFAAELLMPCDVFRTIFFKNMKDMGINDSKVKVDDLVRVIVIQMGDFMVPYEAVRKRLRETEIINNNVKDYLKKNQKEILKKVAIYSKDQNSRLESETMIKTIPGIRTLVERAAKIKSLDEVSLKKIKNDFDIQDITSKDEILNIFLGENCDGQDGSID